MATDSKLYVQIIMKSGDRTGTGEMLMNPALPEDYLVAEIAEYARKMIQEASDAELPERK